ncbi:type I polyketide synthase [Thalassospira mesophila]|uniref:type I polyketide synthase n=1 Tax=Thalassospira mesophila TaxID=1293891 RepID=UPI000A1DF315|nr:type I polyketide synthase [Thalassospira mesophila]
MQQPATNCPIAIVGMACRYPDADNPDQLFENALAQRRSFRTIPVERLAAGYFDASGHALDRAYTNQAAVLNGFQFDRNWFRVSSQSYDATDLTHWLALTVARETIDSIRFRKGSTIVANEGIRVVIGNTLTGEFSRANLMRLRWPYVRGVVERQMRTEYPDITNDTLVRFLRHLEGSYKAPFPVPNEDTLAGGLANTIAGRICNHFDFKGGGYTVDGACSSSLISVIDACTALTMGDADMVLAGGVDLSLDPFELTGFSRTSALARDDMLVYDEGSQGFWPGEGCGFLALMRYDDAIEQCEHIHAVIRGWGVSSDGSGGLTRPEPAGQMLAMQRAYHRAGYHIGSVGYFEGHGTGTKVGDTAELTALINARQQYDGTIQPAIISSIKANIGHTKAAAGIAGLLRASKCLSQNILPPTTSCKRPHALFENNVGNLAPSNQINDWQSDGIERRAGVSAMGFGGINTHITLAEGPAATKTSVYGAGTQKRTDLEAFQDSEIFVFAAARQADLMWTLNHVADFAAKCSRAELIDLAAELAHRASLNSQFIWKAALVAATPDALAQKLETLKSTVQAMPDNSLHIAASEGIFASSKPETGKIGLLFSGQGAPARCHGGIYERRFPAVRLAFEDARLEDFKDRSNTDFAQPAIAAASLAGLEMLKHVGITGDVAVGHSLGELAALHWAGHFDGPTLQELATMRGLAMASDANTSGAMAAIATDENGTKGAIGTRKDIFIANLNGPRQTIVSGNHDAIHQFVADLRAQGTACTVLGVHQAFHSPAMAGVSTRLATMLAQFTFNPAQRPVISTVSGAPLPPDTTINAYLCQQIPSPVLFMDAVKHAASDTDLFIEVGPGSLLEKITASFCDVPAISMDVGGASFDPFLRAAAAAFILGCAPNMGRLYQTRFHKKFDWDWNPQFIANPCETIPAATQTPTDAEPQIALNDIQTTNQPPSVSRDGASILAHLRTIIAERTGLPSWSLEESSRMLSDLHLNSITVGEIVTRLSSAIGVPLLVDPTEFADGKIGDIAAAITEMANSENNGRTAHQGAPAGIENWVRYFQFQNHPAPLPSLRSSALAGQWQGYGKLSAAEHALLAQLNAQPCGNGALLCINNPSSLDVSALLTACQSAITRNNAAKAPFQLVILQSGGSVSGFVKSFFLENSDIDTLIITLASPLTDDTSADMIANIIGEITAATPGYSEVSLSAYHPRTIPCLERVAPRSGAHPAILGTDDVLLVTGGGKGISAECAFQLARQSGCALLVLGRSSPADNAELAANLKRFANAGINTSYQIADIAVLADVKRAVAAGTTQLGHPVAAILHGAGINNPKTVANLTVGDIQATLAPKITGLNNVLAVIHTGQLKLLVGFGSIIARMGLHGEADYALCNEWLSQKIADFQTNHPACHCKTIEWSVWAGVGMGQRVGSLDTLLAQGISPISINDGVREFLHIINDVNLPTNLIVSGRYGTSGTLNHATSPATPHRFSQNIRVHYPDVEWISDFQISPQTDPYLTDHTLNGEPVFPAVMALEAMSNAVHVLASTGQSSASLVFNDVNFAKAIIPSHDDAADNYGPVTIRVVALAITATEFSLALRCSTTDFHINHVTARCHISPARPFAPIPDDIKTVAKAPIIAPFNPASDLYQNILFQKGRFQRIQGYQLIEARRCLVSLSPAKPENWFASNLPQTLVLGDAGARDAALHAVQACIPHQTVIPISVNEIALSPLDPHKSYRMYATEIAVLGTDLIYDLVIFDETGLAVEQWRGLKLRAIGTPVSLKLTALPLLASSVERKIAAHLPTADMHLTLFPFHDRWQHRTPASRLTHRPDHRPDGKPDPSADARFRSSSYCDGWKLVTDSHQSAGCDLQTVQQKTDDEWSALLAETGMAQAKFIAKTFDEPLDLAATRIWSLREALKKAGILANAPLVFDPASTPGEIRFHSGETTILSYATDGTTPDDSARICLAIAIVATGLHNHATHITPNRHQSDTTTQNHLAIS